MAELVAVPALTEWAELSRRAIAEEFSAQPAWPRLPLALRAAPGDIGEGRRLVDALTTPVRSGIILTRRRLAAGGEACSVTGSASAATPCAPCSARTPDATLAWLAHEAMRWQHRHASRAAGDTVAGGRHAPGAPGYSYARLASGRAEGGTGDRMIMARPASSGST